MAIRRRLRPRASTAKIPRVVMGGHEKHDVDNEQKEWGL